MTIKLKDKAKFSTSNPSETQIKAFQAKVLNEISKIPFGEVRTYKQIAESIGNPKASRAVGNACNKNPFPFIIPCHRVIGSNGSLTGYAFGEDKKEKLLAFEREIKLKSQK